MVGVLLGFCKAPMKQLCNIFFLLAAVQEFFLCHLCCMQFFSSNKRLQEIFFQNQPPPPPPQELNGRPLRSQVYQEIVTCFLAPSHVVLNRAQFPQVFACFPLGTHLNVNRTNGYRYQFPGPHAPLYLAGQGRRILADFLTASVR